MDLCRGGWIAGLWLLGAGAAGGSALVTPECLDDRGQILVAGPGGRGALNIEYYEWLPAVMPFDR
ncbi:MAG: hypothetical protein JNL89_10825, partial [Rhodanobacteraceae bacterium]|nr:hypothetical protein [Rhodanobacteraceae bacterium]